MLSNMQKFCLLPLLHLFLSFHFSPSNGFNSTAVKVDVGIILDLQTPVGKIFQTCISMAIEDFYSNSSYNTMLVPHYRDSSSDVVTAASEAIDLLKNTQVMVIFGPQRSVQADFVIEIGNKVQVPIISPATSPSLSPQESPYFIRASWSSSSQAKAIAAIVKKFGWREVVFVYEDNTFGNGLLPFLAEDLLESYAVVSNMTAISASAENDQILEHLNKLKSMQARVFVVHMLPPLAPRFFKMAQGIGMMREGYVWIITEVLTSVLDSVDSETIEAMQGVVGLKPYIPSSSGVKNFTSRWKRRFYKENPEIERIELNVFGLWAYDSITALAEGVERAGVTSPKFNKVADRRNLTDLEAIGTSNSGPLLVSLIKNFTSKGLSGDFNITNGELQPSVFEIVNVLGNGASRVGFWTQSDGISKTLNLGNDSKESIGAVVWPGQTSETPRGWEITANARKLRVGVPMKCRTRELVNVSIDEETNVVNASGFCIDVFKEAIKALPYHVELEFIPFKNADQNSTTYNYDSLIEQVQLKNVDAVVSDITISAKRTQMADFTIPYIESGISTVVPIKDEEEKAWIFLEPLTKELWFTIFGFFIFTGFVVWALEHGGNEEFRGPPYKQFGMIFWFSFSTLVFAHREKVRSNLSRFVVIIWLFVVLVLTSSYTANLTSMITVQNLDPSDFSGLTKEGEFIGFKEGSFVRQVLDSTSSDHSKFKVLNSFEEYDRALSLGTSKGGVGAVVDNLPSIRLFLSKYCHKYTMIGTNYSNSGFGFAFQRGSPLAPDVSRTIMQMKENGKMDKISRIWFGEQQGCGLRNGTAKDPKSLTVKRFKGLFLISGFSSFSAIAIFLCIFLYKNRRVLESDVSLKQKLYELAEAFDRQRDDKSETTWNKSRIVPDEMVEPEKCKAVNNISSCYAEEGKCSSIEVVVTRA